jgi:hypothetical protein
MEFITGSVFVVILVAIAITIPTVTSYSFPSLSEIRTHFRFPAQVWLPAELIAMKDDPGMRSAR